MCEDISIQTGLMKDGQMAPPKHKGSSAKKEEPFQVAQLLDDKIPTTSKKMKVIPKRTSKLQKDYENSSYFEKEIDAGELLELWKDGGLKIYYSNNKNPSYVTGFDENEGKIFLKKARISFDEIDRVEVSRTEPNKTDIAGVVLLMRYGTRGDFHEKVRRTGTSTHLSYKDKLSRAA